MMLVGIIHIALLISTYPAYLYITLKSLTGNTSRRFLTLTNIVYIIGFICGMLWANTEWGFYLSTDPKIMLSMLVPLPFIAANLSKKTTPILPCAGSTLIVLNYALPILIGSIHVM
jgi:ABC-type transport system involved in cytochrome c biogenesis permease subunit